MSSSILYILDYFELSQSEDREPPPVVPYLRGALDPTQNT